jgi:uncharacterized membrane protein
MTEAAHLWAIGYDDLSRAAEVREEIERLGGPEQYLLLLDSAVLVRNADGTYTLDRKPFSVIGDMLGGGTLGLLAGLALATPVTAAAVGALVGGAAAILANTVGIDNAFVSDVKALMRPGTSALLVLDAGGDMEVILYAIRGLGGTVLRTNVDLDQARLIEATLRACPVGPIEADTAADL